jgi:hypothetical protein
VCAVERRELFRVLSWVKKLTTALTTTTTATGNRGRPAATAHAGMSWLVRRNVRPEKRKVDSSILSLTTSLNS